MSDLVAIIREIIQAELAKQPGALLGVVEQMQSHADGDTENYGCDVRLRGRDLVLTGVPLAAPHLGTVAPPAPGDVVLIIFAGGQPVIAGRLYSDALPAPAYAAGEINVMLPPDAGKSDRIEMTAKSSGGREWSVKLPDETELTIAEKRVTVKTGGIQIATDDKQVLIQTGGAKIIVKDGGDVEVQGNGNIKIAAQGNLEVNAGGNLTLKASSVAELKGAVVNIN